MKHKKHNFKLKIALHRLISITTTSTTPSTLAPVGLFQGTKVPNWTCAQWKWQPYCVNSHFRLRMKIKPVSLIRIVCSLSSQALISVPSHPRSLWLIIHVIGVPVAVSPDTLSVWRTEKASWARLWGGVEEVGGWLWGWNGETLHEQTRNRDKRRRRRQTQVLLFSPHPPFFSSSPSPPPPPEGGTWLIVGRLVEQKIQPRFKCIGKIWALRGVKHHSGQIKPVKLYPPAALWSVPLTHLFLRVSSTPLQTEMQQCVRYPTSIELILSKWHPPRSI